MPGDRDHNADEERWLDISRPAKPRQTDASPPASTPQSETVVRNPYASATPAPAASGSVGPRDARVNQLAIVYIVMQIIGSALAGLILYVGMINENASTSEFVAIGIVGGLLQLPGIAGIVGLMRRRVWARYFMIVWGVLWMAGFMPIGLLIGGYTIWLLTRPEIAAEFS